MSAREDAAQRLADRLGVEGGALYRAAMATWSTLNPQSVTFDRALAVAGAALAAAGMSEEWTVIGFWHEGQVIVTGVVKGEHQVEGGDVSEVSEEGCWASLVSAPDAEAAERLAVEEQMEEEDDAPHRRRGQPAGG